MSPLDSIDVQASLCAALSALEREYMMKREPIVEALRVMGAEIPEGSSVPMASLPAADRAPKDPGSVGDDKLKAVMDCIRRHPNGIRQADVAAETGLNTGSVSVALRKLEIQGRAVNCGKQNGSTLWTPVQVLAPAA